MDDSRPFNQHPFLMSLLLGKEYVRRTAAFKHVWECTAKSKEFLALREAVGIQISNNLRARFEATVTSRSLTDILQMDLSVLAGACCY